MANDNRCVCCGEIIPEGMIACPNCLGGSKKKLDLLSLIAELKLFEEQVVSEYCIELSDNADCCRFCGDGDCIIVRTIEALERVVTGG
jgi:hypothetical protein